MLDKCILTSYINVQEIQKNGWEHTHAFKLKPGFSPFLKGAQFILNVFP